MASGLPVALLVVGCALADPERMAEEWVEASLSTVLRVEAESMTLANGIDKLSRKHTSGGQVLFFWGGATASRTVTLPAAVDQLTVRAKGEQCAGAPTMVVRINGRQVMLQAVSATSYTLYKALLPIAVTGAVTLEVGFLDDHFTATCDRNLFVDYVDLQSSGTVAVPPPAPAPAPAPAQALLIDDFESASGSSWSFYNGAEFPGARGALTVEPAGAGKVARLAFDFTGGGSYVQMSRRLASALAVRILRFKVQSPPNVRVRLRVVDTTNQTLQFAMARPVDARDATAWYTQAVDLARPIGYWGGANDGVIHGGITSVAILAGDLVDSAGPKVGAILVDDVAGVETLTLSMDPFAAPLLVPPGGARFGSGVGVNIHFTHDTLALDKTLGAGFELVRMDLIWSWIETTRGVYDFRRFDELMASLEARGLGALFILDYGNPLYESCLGCAPRTATEVAAFRAFARAAAAHYAGRDVRFEVWNEPNGMWKPAPSALEYGALLREAVAGVKAGNPQALVSTAGLAQYDFPYARALLSTGAAAGADAFGIHFYRAEGAEVTTDELLLLRSLVAQAMPGKPVWDTEAGVSSTWYGAGNTSSARHRQAVIAARKHLFTQAVGLPLSIYYDIRDDGTDPANGEQNFGLLANDYSDKPAMVAVRTLLGRGKGRQLSGMLPTGLSTVNALALDDAGTRMIALWHTQVGATYDVQVPEPTLAVDVYGAPVALVRVDGKTLARLSEASGPLYLFYPR